ncbi:ChiQ/YbfN family lipoprotein [Nisaea acidiphila]|uniref:ChiQ/YbfN family lipoprotein n=1 Tax=Nisaea acidiphila TaxID=1862145 RepID=A0A9J7AUM9_9PROT|nr:ChiQ/YbfN family lipoprotein [Nisaea acidiphila]UUX50822.1 ChiQ/YbfN family lipoprotein [Nisaea acidiphila]
MRQFTTVSILLAGLLAGCSSPSEDAAKAQKSAYEAQEEVARQRLKLVEQYQSCIKEAEGDKSKEEACQSFLNAAEALK